MTTFPFPSSLSPTPTLRLTPRVLALPPSERPRFDGDSTSKITGREVLGFVPMCLPRVLGPPKMLDVGL